jgi:hypothetical protein
MMPSASHRSISDSICGFLTWQYAQVSAESDSMHKSVQRVTVCTSQCHRMDLVRFIQVSNRMDLALLVVSTWISETTNNTS